MSPPEEPTAKVLFRVVNEAGLETVETVWAVDLGNDRYRLDNSPFYAYSVSWQDVVYAPYSEAESRATFERVLEKSGNRTVRVTVGADSELQDGESHVLQRLVACGCSYEGLNRRLFSVNIPSEVDFRAVRDYLEESNAEWECADPSHYELPGKTG